VLDAMQQFRLADIAKVLQRSQTSAGAVVLGLMDAPEWPWGWTCPLYPIPVYSREFDLSGDQVTAVEQLEQAARQPDYRAGVGEAETASRIARLWRQRTRRK
jgi:hypothetical protein